MLNETGEIPLEQKLASKSTWRPSGEIAGVPELSARQIPENPQIRGFNPDQSTKSADNEGTESYPRVSKPPEIDL
jgi:hypothetical protein